MTEAEIKERLLARDADALDALRRAYESYCAAIVRGILMDPADVEEVVSDVWMQVWTSIPPNRPEHLRLYVGRIARNLALNRLEYRNAGKRAALPMGELESVTPDCALERQALRTAMEAFLRQQRPEHRQMFLRRYWYGDDVAQIAARYGCTKTKVTGILFRLRRKLKAHLEKEELYEGTNGTDPGNDRPAR